MMKFMVAVSVPAIAASLVALIVAAWPAVGSYVEHRRLVESVCTPCSGDKANRELCVSVFHDEDTINLCSTGERVSWSMKGSIARSWNCTTASAKKLIL